MCEIDYWLEDTDDESKLPPYDEEVIALEAIKVKNLISEVIGYRICFAHRVDPNGYTGKSMLTGKVEHYDAVGHGKGGWNIDIVLWHPAPKLPKKYVIY